jgi:hypothetical protein
MEQEMETFPPQIIEQSFTLTRLYILITTIF